MTAEARRPRRERLETYAADLLSQAVTPQASARLRDFGLQRVYARAEAREREKAPATSRRAYRNPSLLRHVAVAAVTVLAVMLVTTTGAYAFSSQAQPGSSLYGAKIFFERARVVLTPSAAGDMRLEMSYCERRMEELRRMLSSGEQRGADRWLREYRRNVEGAGALIEAVSPQQADLLSAQFQELLDRHLLTIGGMRDGHPPALSESIEGAYRVCEGERTRMRMRCGQQDGGGPPRQPGAPGMPGDGSCGEGSSGSPQGGAAQAETPPASNSQTSSGYPSPSGDSKYSTSVDEDMQRSGNTAQTSDGGTGDAEGIRYAGEGDERDGCPTAGQAGEASGNHMP